MATVFPWTSASPLVGLALLGSLLVFTLLLAYLRQRAARALDGLVIDAPHAPFYRRARFLRRGKQAVGWSVGVGAAYGAAYASTWIWEPLAPMAFLPMVARIGPILVIVATFIVANLAIEAARDIPERAQQLAAWRGKKANRQLVHAGELFLRYAIMAGAAVLIGASFLELVGLQGNVGGAILAWTTSQAGALFLIASLVAIGWIGGRLVRAVANEIRYTTKRVSPQVVDALGATARGVLYTILGLIGIFTILQSIGLGSVGGTLVVVMSSFIGLTVAMAGTGSIGNALSGMVLLGFRPLDKGDRVIIGDDMVCDVEEVTLMFTRVRTLAREVTEVPNNQILLKRIRNLSRSGPHAIVVKMGIGYDVPHTRVRELALEAAAKTEGVLKEPAPALYARELANYAIDYELYAYTSDPRHLQTRSDLLGHLQELFGAAQIEILTPDVFVVRRGRTVEVDAPPVSVPVAARAEEGRGPAERAP